MSLRITRVIAGAAIAVIAVAALRLPAPRPGDPSDVIAAALEPDLSHWSVHDTLRSGETLGELLARRGIGPREATRLLAAAKPIDPRRVRAGLAVEVHGDTIDPVPLGITFRIAVDRNVRVTRDSAGWTATEEVLPWIIDTVKVRGVVTSSLYEAVAEGARNLLPRRAADELAWNLADIYEYRIDMSRELRQGDEFRAVFERMIAPDGSVRIGAVLVAGLQRAGTEVQAFRFSVDNGRSRYYDQQGRSLASSFLRAPLSFRRISSTFGNRRHPVLGTWRQHQGMDYAANAGTPVHTIGDGTVIFVGSKGGYGNAVEVRHPNGFVTRYGHLRGFAPGIRRGVRVEIKQTIGYVGMTGLATGPHLHFEVLVNGQHRDPRRALDVPSGPPLSGPELALFERIRDAATYALELPAGVVRVPQD
ncbi:MAG: M23 family metallopeptidase [Gemmatimonadaceae bacterium]